MPQPASGTNVTLPSSSMTSPALTMSWYGTAALITGNTTDMMNTNANTASVGRRVRRSRPNNRSSAGTHPSSGSNLGAEAAEDTSTPGSGISAQPFYPLRERLTGAAVRVARGEIPGINNGDIGGFGPPLDRSPPRLAVHDTRPYGAGRGQHPTCLGHLVSRRPSAREPALGRSGQAHADRATTAAVDGVPRRVDRGVAGHGRAARQQHSRLVPGVGGRRRRRPARRDEGAARGCGARCGELPARSRARLWLPDRQSFVNVCSPPSHAESNRPRRVTNR